MGLEVSRPTPRSMQQRPVCSKHVKARRDATRRARWAAALPAHDCTQQQALAFCVNGAAIDPQGALAEVKSTLVPLFKLVFSDQLHAGSKLVVAAERSANLVTL